MDALSRFKLGVFPCRDINADAEEARGLSLRIALDAASRGHPTHLAIRQDDAVFAIISFALLNRVFDRALNPRPIIGVHLQNELVEANFVGSRPAD